MNSTTDQSATLASMNIDSLEQQARAHTGLNDFGDPGYREGLEVLIDALQTEAHLSEIGRHVAMGMIVGQLCSRLQIIDYRAKHPELCNKPIEKPLIVLGLPRTGTTILFELLTQDPALRSPLTWELQRPVPPARPETFNTDPRIAEVEASLRQSDQLAPDLKAMHATGALLPEECLSILSSYFASELYGSLFHVPTYRAWLLNNDMTAAYQWHQCFLQYLQSGYMKDRWLLKAPVHIGNLGVLLGQYPDACIVQTHREPMEVIGSVSSLECTLRGMYSDDVDPLTTGPEEAEYFAELLRRGMEQREALDREEQFFDMQFQDIVADPIPAIRAMYDHFGFELTPQVADAMQNYLDNRPREKHGKHRYTLDQFGLSKEQHGYLYEQYRERYIK